MHVLIIDDEVPILELLRVILLRMKYVVDMAEGGEMGIKKIELKKYDLIVTDIKMPDISGFQVLDFIKTTDNINKATPVIGMSGTSWLADKIVFDSILTKPFFKKDLLEAIRFAMH